MLLLAHLIFSVLSGYGMAIILVEKKRQWPVRRYHLLISKKLKIIHPRLPKMLKCTVCTSFWTTLVAELLIFIVSLIFGYPIYFLWPLSGFITAGIVWTIVDILVSLGTIAENKNGTY